ncbi:hypothetical protein ISS03_01280 [Patescibacteria group bacterium]|nr:hypothetical protein [Patescibacteria group bacterium]
MNKNIKKKIQYTLIPMALIFLIWLFPKVTTYNNNDIWLEMNPIKCLGNPWEFEWLKAHPSNYANYPKEQLDKIDEDEIVILKDHYKNNNLKIKNVKSISFTDLNNQSLQTCEICSCPQGYTLYVLVDFNDAKKMLELGWNKSNKTFE